MNNNNLYNADFRWLTRKLIKTDLRQTKTLAFLYACTSFLAKLQNDLVVYRNYISYRLSITPQVTRIEALLNDRYDVSQRRIRIVKAIQFSALPFFVKDENKPVKLYQKSEEEKLILYTKSETAQFTVDFIIRVPVQVVFNMDEMMNYIADDVLQSKTYKIQIV